MGTYSETVDPASGSSSTTYTLTSPEQGTWAIHLDGTGLATDNATYQLLASGDSSLALQAATEPFFHNGRQALIACSLLDLGIAPPAVSANATVNAQVISPDGSISSLTLADDGAHDDGGANDGVYAAIHPNLTQPGQHYIAYRAAGNDSNDLLYTRYDTGGFTVSSENASLTQLQLFEETSSNLQWLDSYADAYLIPIGPQIVSQPQSISVASGSTAQMSVAALGEGTLNYQWLFGGVAIANQTDSTLSLNNVTTSQTGNYSVVVSDATGTVASDLASLSLLTPFEQWRSAYFNGTQVDDPLVSGWDALPQGDGFRTAASFFTTLILPCP